MTPGRKFSSTTSAERHESAWLTASCALSFRSRTTDFLPRLSEAKFSE